MSKKKRSPQRTERLQPSIPALKPSAGTMPAHQPSGLQIAADTIDELTQENANLRGAPKSDLTLEARMYAELQEQRRLYRKEIAEKMTFKRRWQDLQKRTRLLEDRLLAMQIVADQKEKQA